MTLCSPSLLGQKCKPIIIRDAYKAIYLLLQGTLSNFCTNVPYYFIDYSDSQLPVSNKWLYVDPEYPETYTG